MNRFTKAASLAAVAVCSAAGVASATTVDVFYKFNTAYGLNCDFNVDCQDQDYKEGNFELRFSYNNVTIDQSDSYAEGFDAFWLHYGGETTASLSTPIGPVSFQAIGRGGQRIDFNEDGAFVAPSENFSSVLDPRSKFFRIGGSYNFGQAETSVINGNRTFYFGSVGLFDVPGFFRLENEDGTFITGDTALFDTELEIAVSGIAETVPSPVPLPATLPLLALALGGLGFGAHRRKISQS